jgi:hypothetical protein
MGPRLGSIVVAAALAAATACSGKAKPAPTAPPPADPPPAAVSDAELDAAMTTGMTFLAELGDALAAVAGQDCAIIAKTIEDTVARNAAAIEAATRYDHDPAVKPRADAWLQAHEGELTAAAAQIGPAVAPCTDDPAVQAAAAKLGAM